MKWTASIYESSPWRLQHLKISSQLSSSMEKHFSIRIIYLNSGRKQKRPFWAVIGFCTKVLHNLVGKNYLWLSVIFVMVIFDWEVFFSAKCKLSQKNDLSLLKIYCLMIKTCQLEVFLVILLWTDVAKKLKICCFALHF